MSFRRRVQEHNERRPSAWRPPKPPPAEPGALVFRDDFADLRNWKRYDSLGHDGRGYRHPGQVRAVGGICTIKGTSTGVTGGMSLIGHDVHHGTVNVRMRSPQGAGRYHPVALLWGLGSGADVDAITGEIDFVEFWNRPNRDVNDFTLHYGDGTQMVGDRIDIDGTAWHTYSVTWTPTEIKATVDGRLEYFRTLDVYKFPKVPMELCLQLDWFPAELGVTGGAASMDIDWVEIRSV